MSREHLLLKVYGHVWPASPALHMALLPLVSSLPAGALSLAEMLELDKDLLRISYEGVYFPLDEVLAILDQHLTPQSQGKLDYLDLEAWTLTRHRMVGTQWEISRAPLNAVLDYSGH